MVAFALAASVEDCSPILPFEQFLDEARHSGFLGEYIGSPLCPGQPHIKKATFFRILESLGNRENEVKQWVIHHLARECIRPRIHAQEKNEIGFKSLRSVKREKLNIQRVGMPPLP